MDIAISSCEQGTFQGSRATFGFLRLYANGNWVDSNGQQHIGGAVDSSQYYESFPVTIDSDGIIHIPSINIQTTTDAQDNPNVRITAAVYIGNGKTHSNVLIQNAFIPVDLEPSTTWEIIRESNEATQAEIGLPPTWWVLVLGLFNTLTSAAVKASYSQIGVAELSKDPESAGTPIALGANDPKVNTINAADQRYASFSAAVDAVAALSGTNILEITTAISTGTKSIPADVIVQFTNGGKITATSGTVTILGEIRAPATLCFVESGGSIDISGAKSEAFYFEWYGITSGSDNYTSMQWLLDQRKGTYLATNNGTNIQLLEETIYSFATPLDMESATGIRINGTGGGLRYPSSEMRYTGGNTARAIDIRSAFDLTFTNLRISYTNVAFAGVLMEAETGSNGSCSYFYFQNVAFTGTTTAYLASALLKLNDTNNAVVSYCRFEFAQYGLQGTDDASGFSYAISVTNSIFKDCGEAIRNPSQSWTISSNVFEAIFRVGGLGGNYRQGDLRIIGCATTHAIDNIRFLGNWCGDSSASASTYYVFELYGAKGFEFSGNFVDAAANLGTGGLSTMFGLSACYGGSIVNNSFQASDYFVTYHTSGSQGINISNNQTQSILNPVPRALGGLPLLQQTQLGNPNIENMIDGYVAFTDDAATNAPLTSSVNSIIVGTATGANLGYGQAAIRLARTLTGVYIRVTYHSA